MREVISTHFPDLQLFPEIHTLAEARMELVTRGPDLLITDINLQEGEIFELLQEIMPVSFRIIFVTAYSKHAVRAFRFSALDFLEKPFSDNDLVMAVRTALSELEAADYNQMLRAFYHNYNPATTNRKLVLKNLESVHVLGLEEILYLRSDNNYTEAHTLDDRKIVVSRPLKAFESQLGAHRFFRTHQSYLVNLDHIKTFHRKDHTLELTNGDHVAVSSKKAASLLARLSG